MFDNTPGSPDGPPLRTNDLTPPQKVVLALMMIWVTILVGLTGSAMVWAVVWLWTNFPT